MPANTLTRDRLRALADVRPDRGRVLSVFLSLDPTEFASPAARTTEINSVLKRAQREAAAADGLSAEERQELERDVERVREALHKSDLPADGTRGVAVYACEAAGLFELVRLPVPVEPRVVLDRSPHMEPLAVARPQERWGVLLCNRRAARVFIGHPEGLRETDRIEDDVHRQHDQGGWSQARYQRGVDKEVVDHLKHVADVVFSIHKSEPFDGLLIGAPEEMVGDLENTLHAYLRERIRGHLHLSIENSSTEDVRAAARACLDKAAAKRQDELLASLDEKLGRQSKAAAGREDVEAALEQGKVATLLVNEGRTSEFEALMGRAIEQRGEVIVVRDSGALTPHGGLAALLRF
jgi:peptide subunit release factor 1 (eRF1)